MINNKTDIIGYMQLFFKFWPIGSPEEAYYMEYKCDFTKPLNEDFFKYVLGTFGKVCEEQDEKKRIFEGKYIDYEPRQIIYVVSYLILFNIMIRFVI